MADGNRQPGPPHHVYDHPGVAVSIAPLGLPGTLVHPTAGQGIVLFAHGRGSRRQSPRNRLVAKRLQQSGLGTLLFDLLQPEEADNRRNVFDISLLARRLALATDWVRSGELRDVPIGYFGASTGAGAALVAETLTRHRIAAIVSRGGRRLILAVLVAPPDTLERLRAEADEVVCLMMPEPFYAVGKHYDDFTQTSDREVIDLLEEAQRWNRESIL